MTPKLDRRMLTGLACALALQAPLVAWADGPPSVVIGNGTVALGVNSDAAVGDLGIAPQPGLTRGATPTSCACSGWELAVDAALVATGQLPSRQVSSFAFTDIGAVSTVVVHDPQTGSDLLRVTHDFHPTAGSANLYEVHVVVENLTSAPVQVGYARTLGWSPAVADPTTPIVIDPSLGTLEAGPPGRGARFDVNEPPLEALGTQEFRLYLGAAGSDASTDMNQGLSANGADLISFASAAGQTIVFGYAPGASPVTLAATGAPRGGGGGGGAGAGGGSGSGGGGRGSSASAAGGGSAGPLSPQIGNPGVRTSVGPFLSRQSPLDEPPTTSDSPVAADIPVASPLRFDAPADPAPVPPDPVATPEVDSLTLSASSLAALAGYAALRVRLLRRRNRDQAAESSEPNEP